jgi:hypothetical protein
MFHREPDADSRIEWRQLSGLGEHGEYHASISEEEAYAIAGETIAYEVAFLEQSLEFYRAAGNHFKEHGLRHVQKVRDDRLRAHAKGALLDVRVYHRGRFAANRFGTARPE